MATYLELYTLRGNVDLRQKIAVALTIAADTIRSEVNTVPGHDRRVTWAKDALGSLDTEAERALRMLLAANKGATVAQIKGASDVSIQTNVDAIVTILANVDGVVVAP